MVMNDCFFAFFFFSIQFQRISAFSSVEFWTVLVFFFFLSFISLLFTPVMNIVMKDYARGNKRF